MRRQEQAANLVRQRAEETLKAKRKVMENPDQGLPSLVHELQAIEESWRYKTVRFARPK
jgi:hypothetical protein